MNQEKELTRSVTVENDKLLDERRRLLQQLNEEERNKKDDHFTATLSKRRYETRHGHCLHDCMMSRHILFKIKGK